MGKNIFLFYSEILLFIKKEVINTGKKTLTQLFSESYIDVENLVSLVRTGTTAIVVHHKEGTCKHTKGDSTTHQVCAGSLQSPL